MAKKEEKTISLIDTFSEFKELKNIDRTTMVSVLEELAPQCDCKDVRYR